MIELKPHQIKAAKEVTKILLEHNFALLEGECRVGKTLTVAEVVYYMYSNKIIDTCLVITTASSKSDIISQFQDYIKDDNFKIEFCAMTSLHKAGKKYDLLVCDEYHNFGYIQKKNLKNKLLDTIDHKHKLGMSGTPFTENFADAYSLFPCYYKKYKNFYAWAKIYVNVKDKRFGQGTFKDYTEVKNEKAIKDDIAKYIYKVTQEEAGFKATVVDVIHLVSSKRVDSLTAQIKKDKVIQIENHKILADSQAKEFQIVRQLQGGALKISNSEFVEISFFKLNFIEQNFLSLCKKIAIYYDYKAEYYMLEEFLINRKYNITDDFKKFNKTDYNTVFLGQFLSKREGVNLSASDDLIFYSIPYSNLTYQQTRQRCLTMDKTEDVRCHFLLTPFELKVYKKVIKKAKAYTLADYNKFKG